MIEHIHKNNKSNLVQLCDKCHNDVHNNNLIINGYIQTSNGIKSNYLYLDNNELNDKINKRKKYDQLELNVILNLKLTKLNQKNACVVLKEKHNINISKTTLSKIWNGKY